MKKRKSLLDIISSLDKGGATTQPIISRMGGRLRKYATGGNPDDYLDPKDAAYVPSVRDMFPKPTVSSTLSDTPSFRSRKLYTDFEEASKPDTTTSKGAGWGEFAKDAVPFISNAANAFRKLPAPYQPVQESYFRSPKANLSASRNSIERFLRTTQQGNRLGLGNKQVAAANSADAMGKAIEGNNQVNQQETQLQNQADLQTNYVNSMVGARNTGRSNDYLQSILNQKLTQQQLQYDNLADAGEKYGLQRRDKAQMRMENRKLDILPRFYDDTGIGGRRINPLASQERYATNKFGGQVRGPFIGSYSTYGDGGPIGNDKFPIRSDATRVATPIRKPLGKAPRVNQGHYENPLGIELEALLASNPEDRRQLSWIAGGMNSPEIQTENKMHKISNRERWFDMPNGDFNVDKGYPRQLHFMDSARRTFMARPLSEFKSGGWIQKAINPAHKGYCTPMTKSTCTGRRRALAMTFKKHHGFH